MTASTYIDVEKAARDREPQFERKVFVALRDVKNGFDEVEFAHVLSTSGEAAALAAIPLETFLQAIEDLEDGVRATLLDEAGIEAARLGFSFDVSNPFVFRQVREHTGSVVVEITENTRRGIQDVIARAALSGGHPFDVARRIQPAIGLHNVWAVAVDRYLMGLLEAGTPYARAVTLADQYSNRLIRKRARMIARTETLRAQNMGRRAAWGRRIRQGTLRSLDCDEGMGRRTEALSYVCRPRRHARPVGPPVSRGRRRHAATSPGL